MRDKAAAGAGLVTEGHRTSHSCQSSGSKYWIKGNYYNCALVRAASQSMCLETLDKLISGNGGILRMFFCVVAVDNTSGWKRRFQKQYFQLLPREDLGYAGKAILKFRASIHYHVPKLWTPAHLKTQSELVCSECCIVAKSREQLSVVRNTYGSEITGGAKISLFQRRRARWSLFIITTEIK